MSPNRDFLEYDRFRVKYTEKLEVGMDMLWGDINSCHYKNFEIWGQVIRIGLENYFYK